MRRSSRLESATAEKRKTKMSTRLAEHAKRQRRELAHADPDAEPEDGEEVNGQDDSDFIASSDEGDDDEEDEAGEEEEDEEEDDYRPRARERKRKASAPAPVVVESVSMDSDNSAESMKKVKSILKQQGGLSAISAEQKKPKSILKRPKTQSSAESSPDGKSTAPKSNADAAGDPHRRPGKQRASVPPVDSTSSGGNVAAADDRPERSGFLGSISRSRGGVSGIGNTMTKFFIEILEWDFHDALMRQAYKDFAVVTTANDGSEEGEVEVTRVPSKFDSYEHYFSVWKPLAIEEVQAQTLNNVFTEQPTAIPIEAAGLGTNFLDRTVKIRIDVKRTGVPMTQKSLRQKLDSIFVNDLVLFTPNQFYFRTAFQVHGNGNSNRGAPTQEANDNKDGFLGIIATQRGGREGVTVTVLSNAWRDFESRKEELFAFKLNNLVTSVREFRALCDCENYRLLPLLLSGEHRPGSMQLDTLGVGYVRWLRSAFNESQLEAITAAATSDGFTLIKGPPGTGKTTTLKGLLNSLHLREYNRYYNAVLDVARRPDHETNQAWAKIGNEKPHILVTAPSNAAVDNIIGKIISEGFCDGEGRKYFPKIVRVGRGMSANVRVVGLDDMVDQICGQSYDVLQHKLLSLRRDIMQVERDSIELRRRFRHVVEMIDQDPIRILADETKQFQLQQQQQEQQQRLQQEQHQRQQQEQEIPQPAPPDSPTSPPPAPPVDSPPPPGQHFPPSASSPPPFGIGSPPPNLSLYPSTPPAYAQSPSSPPAPQSPIAPYGESYRPYSFGNDQDEVEEEDEAFPTTYGPTVTSPASESAPLYNAVATSQAFNAFFDDDDDEMNAEEDEPLPNALSSSPNQAKLDGEDSVSDHDEDEAFPPLPADHPEPALQPNGAHQHANGGSKEDSVSPKPEQDDESSSDPTTAANGGHNMKDDVAKQELISLKSEHKGSQDHVAHHHDPSSPHELEPKQEPLQVVVEHTPFDADFPMSPPPPPPMSPPPPPPMSPPPPPPPGSPVLKADELIDQEAAPSGDLGSTPEIRGPIVYERYLCYRTAAQHLNLCLERLSELRLEENRYYCAMKAVSDNGRPGPQLRQSLEVSFLDTAHIVFTTLSSAGVTALDVSAKYDVLVVDEAAQAVELSSIIPMKFGSRQCVLVGDPQQLSATVFSRTSGVSLYERSLFERLETTNHPVHMLRTQYRSHPLISDFPRHYFYDGKLQDADTVKTPKYERPYHRLGAGAFTPLVFWNLLNSRETSRSVSRLNVGEAEMAVNLYLTLKNSCPPDTVAGQVGVITPYSQQMDELRNRFRRALGDRYDSEVEINTVDGFQGREKDIIILSTVRADPKAGVGFLNDTRRMNVALTRAKFSCYVIGSENTLRSSKPWAALMDHAYKHECIVHVQDPNCNLLTLRPMEMPVGAPHGARRGGGGGKKHFQHPPPPRVQIPPQAQGHYHHQQPPPSFTNNGGPMPSRQPSPSGAPSTYGSNSRGPSPTNQAWRGGRGRGAGRDARRDPRLNGRGGGRGGSKPYNGGRGSGVSGPPGPVYGDNGPPPHQFSHPHFQAPPNGNFAHPPPHALAPPPGVHGPPPHAHFGAVPPPQQPMYPPQVPPPVSAFQGPPHHQFQQHNEPPPHMEFQGPPPPTGFGAPPPRQQMAPRQFQDGGRGGHGGRIRDPRLLRQQGRGG